MGNILDSLHTDHKNFSKLLSYLDHQVTCIKDCEVVDFDTIMLCIKYMKEFPDAIHHPLENIIFDYFLQHHGSYKEEIKSLFHDHEEMPVKTEKILTMLQSVLAEEPINRDSLCDTLSTYIEDQKAHMNYEESTVYPELYKKMNDNDWKTLNEFIEVNDDPLFGDNKKERYESLFTIIKSSL